MMEMVDCTPDMVEPIHAKHVVVFLDDKDVTEDCFYARLPITPHLQVKSEVGLFLRDVKGRHYLLDGYGGKDVAKKTYEGIVWWKY